MKSENETLTKTSSVSPSQMEGHKRSTFAVRSTRLLLAGLLLFSGFAKLDSPQLFLDFVSRIGFAPPFDRIALVSTIFVELLLGALCLSGIYLCATLAAISALMLLFSLIVGIALAGGLHETCGCFGATFSNELDGLSLLRNLVLAGLAMHASRRLRRRAFHGESIPQADGRRNAMNTTTPGGGLSTAVKVVSPASGRTDLTT